MEVGVVENYLDSQYLRESLFENLTLFLMTFSNNYLLTVYFKIDLKNIYLNHKIDILVINIGKE